MSEDVARVLREARKLIEDPERWTKEEYSLTAIGGYATPSDPSACKFCAVGALSRVFGLSLRHVESRLYEPARKLLEVIGGHGSSISEITRFNDDHSHADVLAAFDRAIELATREGAAQS